MFISLSRIGQSRAHKHGGAGCRRPGHCPGQELFSRSATFSETLEKPPASVACELFMALGPKEIKPLGQQARSGSGHKGSGAGGPGS